MKPDVVRQYIGKKMLIVLKNSFQYTAVIPSFEGDTFQIIEKYGKQVPIDCSFIAFMEER